MEEPEAGSAHTRHDDGDAPESIIRITAAGKERHYISYATGLLLEKGERPVQVAEGRKEGGRGKRMREKEEREGAEARRRDTRGGREEEGRDGN